MILNYDDLIDNNAVDEEGEDKYGCDMDNNYSISNIGHDDIRWNKPNDKTCIFSILNSSNIDKFNNICAKDNVYLCLFSRYV
jgi:hypothetical protein